MMMDAHDDGAAVQLCAAEIHVNGVLIDVTMEL